MTDETSEPVVRRYAELYFLSSCMTYDPEYVRRSGLDKSHYVRVISYPQSESLAHNPNDCALEFMGLTTCLAWHSRLRRAIRPGDAFTFDGNYWLYIPTAHARILRHMDITAIHNWTELPLCIVRIPNKRIRNDQSIRCNVPSCDD